VEFPRDGVLCPSVFLPRDMPDSPLALPSLTSLTSCKDKVSTSLFPDLRVSFVMLAMPPVFPILRCLFQSSVSAFSA